VHQAEIRIAERLIGRQGDDLRERGFRLGELLAAQVREAEGSRGEDGGIALEAPRGLAAAAGDEEQGRDDGEKVLGTAHHGGTQHRAILAGGQDRAIWFTA